MFRMFTLWLLLALLPPTLVAQSIPIKTVPVAEGDQFLLFPSQNLAMGGVSIALDDPWHDPFINPAKGGNMTGLHFVSTPVYYSFSTDMRDRDAGSGRTLPMGMLVNHSPLFGGAVVVWQELVAPERQDIRWMSPTLNRFVDLDSNKRSLSRSNIYLFGMAGMQIPNSDLSVGASALVADLQGLEGVNLLYVNSNDVHQAGNMAQYRLGLYYAGMGRQQADLVLLHHRFNMTHTQQRWNGEKFDDQTEFDETYGWAVQAGYQHKISNEWRLGAQLTGDWKHHPKIPNYDLMQIPRDPGNSAAYNIGIGMARRHGNATFGLDMIYEPIWSHTWADALNDIRRSSGAIIPAGYKTVDNEFRFRNVLMRMGVHHEGELFDFLFGVNMHGISYHLEQEDFVAENIRRQDESWTEWLVSAGFGARFPEFQIRYLSRLKMGTGRPGTDVRARSSAEQAFMNADFIVAPNGPLTLTEAHILTHQVTVIVPLL